jgi:hypothetical protein
MLKGGADNPRLRALAGSASGDPKLLAIGRDLARACMAKAEKSKSEDAQ